MACAKRGRFGRGLIAFTRSLEQAVKAGDSSLEQVARLELAMWQDRLVRVRARFLHRNWGWARPSAPMAAQC